MSNNKAGDLGNAKSSNKEAIKIHITTHDMANIDSQKELISNFLIFIYFRFRNFRFVNGKTIAGIILYNPHIPIVGNNV